ncbi:MAG: DMT family transporter [Alphaproteobacteria bacterium]
MYASTVLIWGSTWLVIKFQLGVVAPELSVGYRFALAAVLLLIYCVVRGRRMRFGTRDHVGMAMQGLFLFSANYFVFYLATSHLTTGLIAVVFSSIVVANIILGRIFLGSPIRPRVAVGAGLGIVGLAVIFWPEVRSFDLAQGGTLGLALSLLGTVLASIGNITSVANQMRGLPVLQANAYGMTYGALFMILLAFFNGSPFTFEWTPQYISSLLYLSVFGSIVAFGCYLTLLGRIGADKGAYATVLFPVIALTLSTLFEDYQWSAAAAIGMVLVLVGNVLVLKKPATH